MSLTVCVGAAVWAPSGWTAPRGAVNTTDDPGWSGPSLPNDSGMLLGQPPTAACLNGIPGHTTPAVNCNIYQGTGDVFFSGSPKTAALGPGTYFFAVLAPGSQHNPNDPTASLPNPGNLSANPPSSDPATDREFGVDAFGNVFPILSVHAYDSQFGVIQVAPYDQTPDNGGVYILAACRISDTLEFIASVPTVTPKDCKYDAFKVENYTFLPRCVYGCGCPIQCAPLNGPPAGVTSPTASQPSVAGAPPALPGSSARTVHRRRHDRRRREHGRARLGSRVVRR